MFKTEKIFLILLTGICLIISIVLLDSVMDPALLMRTVYARFSDPIDPSPGEIYIPEIEEEIIEEISDELSPLLQEDWDRFRSEGFAFEIQYPKQVVRKSNLNQDALNAGVGVNPEAPVWEFHLDIPELCGGKCHEDKK